MNKLNRFGNKHRDRYTCVSSLMSISMHLRESMNSYFCRSFARHFRDPQTWTSLALRLKIGDKTGTLAYPVWCLSMHLRESVNNYFCGFLARHFRDPLDLACLMVEDRYMIRNPCVSSLVYCLGGLSATFRQKKSVGLFDFAFLTWRFKPQPW